MAIVFGIIKTELAILEMRLFEIVSAELKSGNFDSEELALAKNSKFYRHIDFSKINEI